MRFGPILLNSLLNQLAAVITEPFSSFPYIHQLFPSISKTLKEVEFCLVTLMEGELLGGLAEELDKIRGQNVLESIMVRTNVSSGCTIGHGCDRFDEVLTSTGWPSLSKVCVLVITSEQTDPSLMEKLDAFHFRRLKQDKVLFDFSSFSTGYDNRLRYVYDPPSPIL